MRAWLKANLPQDLRDKMANHDLLSGEMLQQRMRESHEYDEAMRRFLAKKPVRLKREGTRYATRDDLHARARLR